MITSTRPALAILVLLGLGACATGGEQASEDQETCLTYGGPQGSGGYRDCLALRAAQQRDEMLAERADGLSKR